jgi:hypothetical protein
LIRRAVRVVSLIAVVLITVLTTTAAMAEEAPYLRTPGRAAYCGSGPAGPHRTSEEYVFCFTPDDGFIVDLGRSGRAQKRYDRFYRHFYPSVPKLLRFGHHWIPFHGFRCESRKSGLTCHNQHRHGFWLGRYVGYRLF